MYSVLDSGVPRDGGSGGEGRREAMGALAGAAGAAAIGARAATGPALAGGGAAGPPPARSPAPRLRLLELPMALIVGGGAEREAAAALLEEFEPDGVLGCIEVRERPDGRYDLVDGHGRLASARRSRQPTITAIVEPAEAARLSLGLRALLLNTQRQNLRQLQIGL